MNLLSLDLSVSSTGFCIIHEDKIVKCGRIVTEGKELSARSKKHLDYEYFYANPNEDKRMYYISMIIDNLIEKYKITDVVIENSFMGKNPKTGLLLSKLKGFSAQISMYNSCNVHYLLPTEIRKLLNNRGGSDKELVSLYIRRNYIDVGAFSDKPGKNKTSDIYDAIAVALAFSKKSGIEIKSTYKNK